MIALMKDTCESTKLSDTNSYNAVILGKNNRLSATIQLLQVLRKAIEWGLMKLLAIA